MAQLCITKQFSMAALKILFPGCLISHFGDIPWPPCSLDLTTLNFSMRLSKRRTVCDQGENTGRAKQIKFMKRQTSFLQRHCTT